MARKLIAALCVAFATTACKSEDLGGGYSLEDLDGANHAIVRGNRVIVLPDVARCKASHEVIVCERSKPKTLDDSRFFSKPFGWFVLDTRTGELIQGLDENALNSLLQKKNSSLDWR